jgi:hypothetical protein
LLHFNSTIEAKVPTKKAIWFAGGLIQQLLNRGIQASLITFGKKIHWPLDDE